MGANNSTRKLTLLNDDKAGVIKLSESLAHRLRGQIENDQGSGRESFQSMPRPSPSPPLVTSSGSTLPPSPTPPPSPPPPPVVEEPPQPAVSKEKLQPHCHQRIGDNRPSQSSGDEIPAWSVYAKEAHLMATRLREEKELELKLKDEEWRNKLLEREKEYTEMAKLKEDHLEDTMREVESLFMKVSCIPVCQEQQHNVMKCYQDHSTQTLRCSDEVDSFARCVDLSRVQSVMTERAS